MASFFIYSKDGDSLFLALRLIREGHEVRMFIHNKESKDVGTGLIPKTNSPNPRRGDVVIFDMVGFGYYADLLRKQGYRVLSGGRIGDKLEFDRGLAVQVMRDAQIAVPETHDYNSISEAKAFLKKQDPEDSWYIKPSGDEDTGSTFGAKDIPAMIRWLDYLISAKQVPKKFILQKKMDNKAELSFEGWFDGNKWVLPWNSTIEDKRLLAGDVGPNTGCMANVVWAYPEKMPLLAMRTLTRIAPILRAGGYCGPIDINVIFGEDGTPHGLEFTSRFGYLALQALSLLISGDLGSQLVEFVHGRLDHFDVHENLYSLAIGVSVPPYPNAEAAKMARGIHLDPKLLFDPIRIMPTDVMVIKGEPYITGSDASAAVFADTWHNLHELRSMILGRIKEYDIPKAQYRIDPVERAEEEFEFLRQHDYEIPEPEPMNFKAPFEAPVEESIEAAEPFEISNNDSTQVANANVGDTSFGDSHPYDIPTFNK